jgi:molecular chaperone Hsp33
MHDQDCLHRFVFENLPFRGHLVHLDSAWRALLEHREYPEIVRDTLGQAVASSVLLAATVKFDGVLSLQMQGDGPLYLMLAQCTSGLGVRGVARYRQADVESVGQTSTPTSAAPSLTVADLEAPVIGDLAGTGNLTVTLESDASEQRYQGIVPLSGARLADCLQVYFENSEQLPTRLWLHCDERGSYGMLLQRLPNSGGESRGKELDEAAIDDAWRRVQLIGDTLTAAELRALSDRQILHRLFNEDDLRIFEPAPVFFRCRCSRERVEGMLRALGEAESRSVLQERGQVEVRCDFCNRAYVFDPIDIEQLFKVDVPSESGGSVH